MSWRWFFIGMITFALVSLFCLLAVSAIAGFFAMVIGAAGSMTIAVWTNFGKGHWSYEGYSHSLQGPWPIPPTQNPRLGGFATGYWISAAVTIGIILYCVANQII